MITSKYLSTALITATLLSTASFASDDDFNTNKRSISSDEVEDWVKVKKEKIPEQEDRVLPRQQHFVPTKQDLMDFLAAKKGKTTLNPSGSKTNCLDCSISFFNYMNTGEIVPAADNPTAKPNVLLGCQGASLIDGELLENLCSMKDRPDVIVLEGDKTYQFIDLDGRAQVLFKACGMLHAEPILDQDDNPIKQEPLRTLQETLEAIPLTNGKAVGCIYLEFLPELKEKLGVDNGFTGHFQNFYIYEKSDGTKEILIVDAQDGDILTLNQFLSKNRMKSAPKQTKIYKNRMYVWWDLNAGSEDDVKPELLDVDEDMLTWSHISEKSSSEEVDPETGKRSPSVPVEELEDEPTNKRATPPKEKEELDEPFVEALSHGPADTLTLANLIALADLQQQIIQIKGGLSTDEDRLLLAEYNCQMSTLAEDPGAKKNYLMLAAQQVVASLGHGHYDNRMRILIDAIWGQAELHEGLPDIYPSLSRMAETTQLTHRGDAVGALNLFHICLQAFELAPNNASKLILLKKLNDLARDHNCNLDFMLDKSALPNIKKSLLWARAQYLQKIHGDLFGRHHYWSLGRLWLPLHKRMATGLPTIEDLMLEFEHTASYANQNKTEAFKALFNRLRWDYPSPEILREIHDLSRQSVNKGSAMGAAGEKKHVVAVAPQLIQLAQMRIQALANNATAQDHFDLAEAYFLWSVAQKSLGQAYGVNLLFAKIAFAKVRELVDPGVMPEKFRQLQVDLELEDQPQAAVAAPAMVEVPVPVAPAAAAPAMEEVVVPAPAAAAPAVSAEAVIKHALEMEKLLERNNLSLDEIVRASHAMVTANTVARTPEEKKRFLKGYLKSVMMMTPQGKLSVEKLRGVALAHYELAKLVTDQNEKLLQFRTAAQIYERTLQPDAGIEELRTALGYWAWVGIVVTTKEEVREADDKVLSYRKRLMVMPGYVPTLKHHLKYLVCLWRVSETETDQEKVIQMLKDAATHSAAACKHPQASSIQSSRYGSMIDIFTRIAELVTDPTKKAKWYEWASALQNKYKEVKAREDQQNNAAIGAASGSSQAAAGPAPAPQVQQVAPAVNRVPSPPAVAPKAQKKPMSPPQASMAPAAVAPAMLEVVTPQAPVAVTANPKPKKLRELLPQEAAAVAPVNPEGLEGHQLVIWNLRNSILDADMHGSLNAFIQEYKRIKWEKITAEECLDYYDLAKIILDQEQVLLDSLTPTMRLANTVADNALTLAEMRIMKLKGKATAEDHLRVAQACYYCGLYKKASDNENYFERARESITKAKNLLGIAYYPMHFVDLWEKTREAEKRLPYRF